MKVIHLNLFKLLFQKHFTSSSFYLDGERAMSVWKIFFCLFYLHFISFSQTANIKGVVKDTSNQVISDVQIAVIEDPSFQTISNQSGVFNLTIPANKKVNIVFFNINYKKYTKSILLKENETYSMEVILYPSNILSDVQIVYESQPSEMQKIEPKLFFKLPSTTGNIEDLVKTQIGVTSNNELSSGYSVRGGNFDENLTYINDIEVYRPFLVRSGMQEGLSLPNPEMVQSMQFSAGGFEAKYGDKMSSVLDIQYRKPTQFKGSASAGLLVNNLHLEGISKNHLVGWSFGARYKSNQYLLKTLDTKGDYRPTFWDAQLFLNFNFSPTFSAEVLSIYSDNLFRVIPSTRQTDFGTVNNAVRLTVYFDGQSKMHYQTLVNAVSLIFKPNSKFKLKWINSHYFTNEQELYTVQGQYYIDQLEADPGSENFAQVAFNRGVGTYIENGRNKLFAQVANTEIKTNYQYSNQIQILNGIRFQYEEINDKLNEWRYNDSAGYSIPYYTDKIELNDVYKTINHLQSFRLMHYHQINWENISDEKKWYVTFGVRGNFWTVNQQYVFSPRTTIAFKPSIESKWIYKFSTGFYYQPPFYRELRDIQGNLHLNVKAQQSIHFVLSADKDLKLWNRPFKITMAAYYKQLNQIIPYEIDNVRIRYFANNNATGFATGADFRITGEFVKNMESWLSVGILRTMEKSPDYVHYVYYNKEGQVIIPGYTFDTKVTDSVRVDPGYIPRPTDKLVTVNLFFQDYLPKFPDFKMNLNMVFGTGLPFGPPNHRRWEQVNRMPFYRRVDAGFAYQIIKPNREKKTKNIFNHIENVWIFLEVFNLLQVNNTVSYTWLKDVTARSYAVPNYLTNRQLNLRLYVQF
ncbi:MAG: carboxypeptidase-like regulatory domain-containing protein [Bacteroidia bacterium]